MLSPNLLFSAPHKPRMSVHLYNFNIPHLHVNFRNVFLSVPGLWEIYFTSLHFEAYWFHFQYSGKLRFNRKKKLVKMKTNSRVGLKITGKTFSRRCILRKLPVFGSLKVISRESRDINPIRTKIYFSRIYSAC